MSFSWSIWKPHLLRAESMLNLISLNCDYFFAKFVFRVDFFLIVVETKLMGRNLQKKKEGKVNLENQAATLEWKVKMKVRMLMKKKMKLRKRILSKIRFNGDFPLKRKIVEVSREFKSIKLRKKKEKSWRRNQRNS